MSACWFVTELSDLHCRNARSPLQSWLKGSSSTQLLTRESSATSSQSAPSLLGTTSLLMGVDNQKGTFNYRYSAEITGMVKKCLLAVWSWKGMHRARV